MSEERVLFHSGRILVGGNAEFSPSASAMCIEGDHIIWVGVDAEAPVVDRRVDLQGRLVTPGFVDAHVHATSTGLMMTGLDLTGVSTGAELLANLSQAASVQTEGVILGHGWDDTNWSRSMLPTRAELDAAASGRAVYLSRVDVHSALVSTALVDLAPVARDCEGYDTDGPLSRQAHHHVRDAALGSVSSQQRRAAQRAFLERAATLGIVAVHEMAGPTISSEKDLCDLVAMTSDGSTPIVTAYWGELAREGGVHKARELGAIGAAGDLFVDGSLGSRTACLHAAYSDQSQTRGAAYLTSQEICDHVVACTQNGLQAGFHVIGDAACSLVTEGFRSAAQELGKEQIRAARHRIEHAEMLSDEDIRTLSDLRIAASMQPMFDALWGGVEGMYVQRLGDDRARPMNRLASLKASGVRVMLGSDAPVTPLGPWGAIRAAMHHHTADESVDVASAFRAHTQAAWQGAGVDDAGVLTLGHKAHLTFWDAQSFDDLVHLPAPITVGTMISGRMIHDRGVLT